MSFSLTFYDTISHLVPGTLLLLIILFTENIGFSFPATVLTIALLFFGYVIGQTLLVVGNILYNTYFHPNQFGKKTISYKLVLVVHKIVKSVVRQNYKNPTRDELEPKLNKLFEKKLGLKTSSHLDTFQICDSVAAELGLLERDVLLARQGFYRSLSALVFLVIPYLIARQTMAIPVWILLVGTLTLRLFLYAHTYYGQIRRNQVYLAAYRKLKEV